MILFVALSTVLAMTILAAMAMDRVSQVELISQQALHHSESHDLESDEWKKRIVRLEEEVELARMTNPRPDPFTGSMGRALEARIKNLENSTRALGSVPAIDFLWSPSEGQ